MPRTPRPAAFGEEMTPEETASLTEYRNAPRDEPAPVAVAPEPTPPAPAPIEPAPVEPAPAPAIVAPELTPPAEPKESRVVPYDALHAEREERKKAEAKAAEAAAELAKINGRFETLRELALKAQEPQPTAPPAEPEIPDLATDPVGHFRVRNEILEKRLADMAAWQQQQTQQTSVMNNVQRLQQITSAREAEFMQREPSYAEAGQYVRQVRDAELAAMGYQPEQRMQIMQQDAISIAAQALSANRNPAEVLFAIAKARGFTPKAAEPAPLAAAPAPAPLAAPTLPPLTPTPQAPSAEALKLLKVAEGQAANVSLGAINGGAPSEEDLTSKLLAMSDEDFAKATEGNKWRNLFS